MAIQKATRKRARLRMALDGPSGGGKTLTSLLFAHALAKHYGGRIGVVNSERERLYAYADYPIPGTDEKIEFYAEDLKDYSPSAYVAALRLFEKEGDYTVVLIDSLSHAWAGEGGALEMKDKAGDNSYTAWAQITPLHNRLVNAIIGAPFHLIATMRSKPAYVLEPNEKGKMAPRRVGLEPIQRKGIEYEFGIFGSVDLDHVLRITKSDCSAVDSMMASRPGPDFMAPVIEWLGTGRAPQLDSVHRIAARKDVEEFIRLGSEKSGKTQAQIEEEYFVKKGIEIWHAPVEAIAEGLNKLRKAAQPAAK